MGNESRTRGDMESSGSNRSKVVSPKLDKVEEFKALCEWAKSCKIKHFTFEGNEVEFDPQAFQAKIKPKPNMAPEGLRLLEKQQKEKDFEELLEWST